MAMASQGVRCLNSGCNASLESKALLSDHAAICIYKQEMCVQCNKVCVRKTLIHHMMNLCTFRIVSCKYCQEEFTFQELPKHLKECPRRLVQCKFCKSQITHQDLDLHLETCGKRPRDCEKKNIGCDFTAKREEMERHQQDIWHHFNLLCTHVENMGKKVCEGNREHKKDNKRLQQECGRLKENIKIVENNAALSQVEKTIASLVEELKAVKASNEAKDEKIKQLDLALQEVNQQGERLLSKYTAEQDSFAKRIESKLKQMELTSKAQDYRVGFANDGDAQQKLNLLPGTEMWATGRTIDTIDDLKNALCLQLYGFVTTGNKNIGLLITQADFNVEAIDKMVGLTNIGDRSYTCELSQCSTSRDSTRTIRMNVSPSFPLYSSQSLAINRMMWCAVDPFQGQVLYYRVVMGDLQKQGQPRERVIFKMNCIPKDSIKRLLSQTVNGQLKSAFIFFQNLT